MQYTAIFTAVKNGKFQLKKIIIDIFLIFAQNIDLEYTLMNTHIKVGCKGSTLHRHVCMIGIFELMVNLSTENALHCIIFFFKYWYENPFMPKQS